MASRIVLLLFLLTGSSPCPSTPTPHIHITEEDGGFNPHATCPKGWAVQITAEASEAFNKVRTQAAAVNMLADAPCVREKEGK